MKENIKSENVILLDRNTETDCRLLSDDENRINPTEPDAINEPFDNLFQLNGSGPLTILSDRKIFPSILNKDNHYAIIQKMLSFIRLSNEQLVKVRIIFFNNLFKFII